ncbi:class I SAM-dependent methyltransferase [Fulvivirgaceae bacterium BMA10]|uniref:Class I SAM-dependent methyltransferase n=1 Tax=Splendidivirga corallicola TaxID=3051826 RepID=A0ABT8KHS6_9BACT|nr:class I SAM-dependent methyltransferase [Fulvivirgaceae bacterium BMA10]
MLKGWIKSKTTDRYLRPLREQLISMIEPGTSIVEFGCGTGDLLFRASSQIQRGKGFDSSKSLIAFAKEKKRSSSVDNLEFICADIGKHDFLMERFDYGIASLFIHALPKVNRKQVLGKLSNISGKILIADFIPPGSFKERCWLHIDEMTTGHYQHYLTYCREDGMIGLSKQCGLTVMDQMHTFDPVINIFLMQK